MFHLLSPFRGSASIMALYRHNSGSLARCGRKLLAPSEFTGQQHRAAGFTTLLLSVLPTFSSLEPECVVPHVSGERPRFLFVGRLTASKGIRFLLEDFATLPEFDQACIIGDGELRQLLQAQYVGHPHIRFLGSVPQQQLVNAYQSATALILPSLAPEVFPLTVLEALACGTPVVVHDAGGNREAIEKTGGGFVYRTAEELRCHLFILGAEPHREKHSRSGLVSGTSNSILENTICLAISAS